MSAGAGPEILDSEMLEIEQVLETLKRRCEDGRRLDRGMFDQEIQDRFANAGFKVVVNWYETNVTDVRMPEITITGRTERIGEFDHDKMAHEVTSDILGLGTGGVIKTSGDDMAKIHAVEQGHKHGPSCNH